jgi:hypothetical protein
MSRIVLTNAAITVNAVDLSDYVASVTLSSSIDSIETTAFSSTTARTRIGGLADNSITLEFHQDYASGEVESTIFPLIGTVTAVTVKPVAGATTSDNPLYTVNCLVAEWQPLSGAVGELATASVSWPVSGAITKTVA